MKTFDHPVGSIIELTSHDSPHCGVIVDKYSSIELIAFKDEIQRKMICKLILIDLRTIFNHPITAKPPIYKLRQNPIYTWTTLQMKDRIKTLKSKYSETEYHIVYNNCQHFAWELSTGRPQSPDADKFRLVGSFIGWAFHVKDFGANGSNSSASLTDLQPLQQSLNHYLKVV